MRHGILGATLTALISVIVVTSTHSNQSPSDLSPLNQFVFEIIDKHGPADPWGKTIGHLKNSKSVDILVSGHASRNLVRYKGPGWEKEVVATNMTFTTDLAIHDINGDAVSDIVATTESSLIWLKGPEWEVFEIDQIKLHDIEIADINGDGSPEIIGRNQGAFGGTGDTVYAYQQTSPNVWQRFEINVPDGEGIWLYDLDQDSRTDIVVNQVWLRNTGSADISKWVQHTYTKSWEWPHANISVGDFDGDSRPDIALTPAELEGHYYRISWFQANDDITKLWEEIIIDSSVEAVHHSLIAHDFDLDGKVDLATAKMHQGADPDEILIYRNLGKGKRWGKQVLGTQGSHSMQAADVDQDGDIDLLGVNWSGADQRVGLWRNSRCSTSKNSWTRHVIDNNKLHKSVFIFTADLDNDDFPDIITGPWWYKNPGQLTVRWQRNRFSGDAFHAAMSSDLDDDGDADVLGTRGVGSEANSEMIWAINEGTGKFRLDYPSTAHGDFLQGIAEFEFQGTETFALSWHAPSSDLEIIQIDPTFENNIVKSILSPVEAQNEAITSADIDGDGDLDLVTGTYWLENTNTGLNRHTIVQTNALPDRNTVADINGDGQLDVIVGYEAISRPGHLAWYSHKGDPRTAWQEFRIAEIVGPMSVGTGDVDQDGDIDVVAGEHNLEAPDTARLILFENIDGNGLAWKSHLVYRGDEHHDGAQLVDIDNDGDLDILSIGWGHNRVLLYENNFNQCPGR